MSELDDKIAALRAIHTENDGSSLRVDAMAISVIRSTDGSGVALIIDQFDVVNGEEGLKQRTRIVNDVPIHTLQCIAYALFPTIKFAITEDSSDGPGELRH